MGSPVCGLRPMRALRCAFTARPSPGMTNLPAPPLSSFTASFNSSSKNVAAVFFGVPTLPAMCATILDLLSGFAIEIDSPPQKWVLRLPGPRASGTEVGGTIAALEAQRKSKHQKSQKKCAFRSPEPRKPAPEAAVRGIEPGKDRGAFTFYFPGSIPASARPPGGSGLAREQAA